MPDPLRDPRIDRPVDDAHRTGTWFVRYRNPMRLVLLLLVVSLFVWGWLRSGSGWLGGAAGFAVALAMAWGILEILWFLIDRGSPDSAATPDD